MGGCVGCGWVDGWVGEGGGLINIRDMDNNDVGKGGVRVCEAHEKKKGGAR
jgi:hypothetical protein